MLCVYIFFPFREIKNYLLGFFKWREGKIREITIYYKFFFFLILNHVPDGNRYFPITTPFILSLFLISPIFSPSLPTLGTIIIATGTFTSRKKNVFFIILQPSFPPFFYGIIRRLCRRFNINVTFDCTIVKKSQVPYMRVI